MDRYDVLHIAIMALSAWLAYSFGLALWQWACFASLIVGSMVVGCFEVLVATDLSRIHEARASWAKAREKLNKDKG